MKGIASTASAFSTVRPSTGRTLLTTSPSLTARPVARRSQVQRSLQQRRRAGSSTVAMASVDYNGLKVALVPTKPIEGQKTGTSGLRKKTTVFMSEHYLANWVQSLFSSLGDEAKGKTIGLGGDGRYFNKEAVQIILSLAAGNGIKRVVVGKDGITATPAMSAIIRRRKLYGGLIMSASHNPGGPKEDWGIKFNYSSGEPAPERITDRIFGFTQSISELRVADLPHVDISTPGLQTFGDFEVEVIDYTTDYLAELREVFDFDALRKLFASGDFTFIFDGLHAVTGAYARPLFVEGLGAPESALLNCKPLEDFGGGHPDPNLTYAKELVDILFGDNAPDVGAASDGDGDRNMVLGRKFFVTPSDSVAIIAAYAEQAIPYFKGGLKGVARSMPTSGALDRVAEAKGLPFFETPTGWKFFGNLMDAGKCSICGEESFGTGADHVREKDGLWAVLAWLSIVAYRNKDKAPGAALVSIRDIVTEHWRKYGRNFYSRYDYEGVESDKAAAVMEHLTKKVIEGTPPGTKLGSYTLKSADNFTYTDPIDGSVAKNQGIRIIFDNNSRIIFRLSGTGSAGATIRLYIEEYSQDASLFDKDAQEVLAGIIKLALELSDLQNLTGRSAPTVIT